MWMQEAKFFNTDTDHAMRDQIIHFAKIIIIAYLRTYMCFVSTPLVGWSQAYKQQ